MKRTCPVCTHNEWDAFFKIDSNLILTGDQRIEPGRLSKVICKSCGVVANESSLSDGELKTFYGEAYQLNTFGGEEHLYFTPNGPVPRSQIVFERIAEYFPADAKAVLEIGCGEGNVLRRFAELQPPPQSVVGFEGSRTAAKLAKEKGLEVRNELLLSKTQPIPESDFVYSYNVLEHIEDLDAFLGALRSSLTPSGVIVFGLPVQDNGGYDLFFAEHVWHFTVGHVLLLLKRHGFDVLLHDARHPVDQGGGLFVCRLDNDESECSRLEKYEADHASWKAVQHSNRDHWLSVYAVASMIVEKVGDAPIAVYGSGEVLSLLLSYSNLSRANIVACLDEDPKKIGTLKHGIPVYSPEFLDEHSVECVLLTANLQYHPNIRRRISMYNVEVFSCFS